MKFSPLVLMLCSAPFAAAPFAAAQSSVDVNIGFGTFHDSAISGSGIENNPNSLNYLGTCTPGGAASTCLATPALSSFFLGFGGDVLLTKRYGFGGEVSLMPSKPNYGPLQFRETFYDVNGIFTPINQKKAIVELQGGIGAARTSFSFTQTGCVGTAVCSTQSQPIGNTNHFQVHVGLGVQIFVTEHLFIRPQFDLHYVPNLNQQFNSNVVPGAMIWLGYSLGDR